MSGYFFCNLSGDEDDTTVLRHSPSATKIKSTSTKTSKSTNSGNSTRKETKGTANVIHSGEISTINIPNTETKTTVTNSMKTAQSSSEGCPRNQINMPQSRKEKESTKKLPLQTTHNPETNNDHHSVNEVSIDSCNESQSHTQIPNSSTPRAPIMSSPQSFPNINEHQSQLDSQLRGRLAIVHKKQQHNLFLRGAQNDCDETMTSETCLKRLSQHNENLFNLQRELDAKRTYLFKTISDVSYRGNLTIMNLSRCEFSLKEASLISNAISCNPHLGVLKLSYNNLRDEGASIIAHAINPDGQNHHCNLRTLDLSFNSITDAGCIALAASAVSKNFTLSTLYLSGNSVGKRGTLAISAALVNGCGLTSLSLAANQVGLNGSKALTRAIAECDVRLRYSKEFNNSKNITLDPKTNDTSNFKAIERLILASNSLGCSGCLSISNMILTNSSLRVLCLCNNNVGDRELALLSQAISRNKKVPLQTINLSFNVFSCAGLESLMNAVWGSNTLKELRLDNNRIADRGAQLAAVVLGSVKLTVLDLGFNKIGSIGIKALMKSLSENDSLQILSLSGKSFDTISSKALSYALAYNRSLNELYVDTCQMSNTGKRHVAAGIVSNGYLNLRILSGIKLGEIVVTLGFPKACENWTNEKILTFVRMMWNQNNQGTDNVEIGRSHISSQPTKINEISTGAQAVEVTANRSLIGIQRPITTNETKNLNSNRGPINPNMVVTTANKTYASLNNVNLGKNLLSSRFQAANFLKSLSPILPQLTERTTSGATLFHPLVERNEDIKFSALLPNMQSSSITPKYLGHQDKIVNTDRGDLDQLDKFDWQKKLVYCIAEIANIPFIEEDYQTLWEHFFSVKILQSDKLKRGWSSYQSSIHTKEQFQKKRSHSATSQTTLNEEVDPNFQSNTQKLQHSPTGKRRNLSTSLNESQLYGPSLKRLRSTSFHENIDKYPRIKKYLHEDSRDKEETLLILRRLKFLEDFCFANYGSINKSLDSGKKQILYSSSEIETCILDWIKNS